MKIIEKVITSAAVAVLAYTVTYATLIKVKESRRKAAAVKTKVDALSTEIVKEHAEYMAEIQAAQDGFAVSTRTLSPDESAAVLKEFGVETNATSNTVTAVFSEPSEEQLEAFKDKCQQHFKRDDILHNLKKLVTEPSGGYLTASRYHADCVMLKAKLNDVTTKWSPVTIGVTQNVVELLEVTEFNSTLDNQAGDELMVNRDYLSTYLVELMHAIGRVI